MAGWLERNATPTGNMNLPQTNRNEHKWVQPYASSSALNGAKFVEHELEFGPMYLDQFGYIKLCY